MIQDSLLLLNKWRDAIKDITNDVTDLIENQFVFNSIVEVVNKNKELQQDNLYWDYQKLNYGSTMVLGISRQVDQDYRTYGLINLLKDIAENPSILTIDWFTTAYKNPTQELGKLMGVKDFKENFGNGKYIDEKIIKEDIGILENTTKVIKKFRHERIAHKNKDKSLSYNLDFYEIDKALSVLEKLVVKYQLLLNQAGFVNGLLPVIQYGWEKIFRRPWIKGQ